MVFGCFASTADELHFCLCLARLRYGFLSVYCGLFLSLKGSVGNVSAFFCACGFVAFLGRFGLGFRWCLSLFGSTADELHFLSVSRLVCATVFLSIYPSTAAFSFVCRGFQR